MEYLREPLGGSDGRKSACDTRKSKAEVTDANLLATAANLNLTAFLKINVLLVLLLSLVYPFLHPMWKLRHLRYRGRILRLLAERELVCTFYCDFALPSQPSLM